MKHINNQSNWHKMKVSVLITKLIAMCAILFHIATYSMTPKQKCVGGAVFATFLCNFLIYKWGAGVVQHQVDSYNMSIEKDKSIVKDLKKFKKQFNSSEDSYERKQDFIKNMKTFFVNHKDHVKLDLKSYKINPYKKQICSAYDPEEDIEYEYEIIDEEESLFNQYMNFNAKVGANTKERIQKLKNKRQFLQENKTEFSWFGMEYEKIGLLALSNWILVGITVNLMCLEEKEFLEL